MNKVYLDENGNIFINGQKIENVISISTKTDFNGTSIVLEFSGEYESNFFHKSKAHSLNESAKE